MSELSHEEKLSKKKASLLENDFATECPECGAVVFEWFDACRVCDGDTENEVEQTTLITDGGRSGVSVDRSEVEYIEPQHWRYEETDYVLGHTVTGPCHECDYDVPDDEAAYIREGPGADNGFDHVCWDCGQEVTGFGE